jgi:hypothetical protein
VSSLTLRRFFFFRDPIYAALWMGEKMVATKNCFLWMTHLAFLNTRRWLLVDIKSQRPFAIRHCKRGTKLVQNFKSEYLFLKMKKKRKDVPRFTGVPLFLDPSKRSFRGIKPHVCRTYFPQCFVYDRHVSSRSHLVVKIGPRSHCVKKKRAHARKKSNPA